MSRGDVGKLVLASGVAQPLTWANRQYGAVGTGTTVIEGSYDSGLWETFLTLAPGGASTLLSQRSADMYPWVRQTTTGSNTVFVTGLE